ncbi:glycosyltransferase [Peribacillus sp. NPDC097284]|uniref:glycosyltransferase n=1 Tax=Peribacillus sp. NPDC097284 TaxID=3364401 RepID=UPI00382312CC
MKKILFISKSDTIGGLEKVLLDIVCSLDISKYEITVMTGSYNEEIQRNLPQNIYYKNLFKKKFRGLDSILVYFPPFLLHKFFIKQYYDIEISFQEGYPTKIISGAHRKTKKVCWLHNDPDYYDFNLPFFRSKKQLKKNLNKFDNVIAVSNFIVEGYKKYIDLNTVIQVIYNPIDFKKIKELSNEHIFDLTDSNGKFRICYLGRLSEEKQVDMLVESVISLHDYYRNIELIIIGVGHKHEDLYNRVQMANAEGYIKLLGYKNNPYPYLSKSSLLVCCSITESFCLSVVESIALNIPVLSTKCGGPEEILDNSKYGLLVENNYDSLSLGIKSMLDNRELFMDYKNFNLETFNKFEKSYIISQIENMLEESSL